MNVPIIEAKNLRKTFLLKKKSTGIWANIKALVHPEYKEKVAVDDISFTVDQGEIVAFIGPNGAGKSTTMKMLTGILYPTSGSIRIIDYNPATQRLALSYHIGTVFGQRGQLWYHLPPIDTYQLYARIYGIDQKAFEARMQFLIETFEIGDLLHVPVRKLSMGQRMRCEIAGSLIHSPKILFLDEPTIGLDVIAKQQVRDAIKYLNEEEKVTIFLTSHDAGDIEKLTKRTIVINHGTIIFDDTTEALKKYLTTKIIELVLEEPAAQFHFEGGTILESTKHTLTIELDLEKTTVEKLLSYALENFVIIDINIFAEPLEKIIGDIYQEPKA
jgi:ABC-2 type transport system ATP-binding protein